MADFQYSSGESRSGSSSRSSSSSGTLPFYNKQVEDLLKRGVTASQAPYQAYQGDLVAGFSPVQNQAFDALQGAVGDWQPGLNQAQAGLNQAQNIFGGLLNSPYTAGALGQIAGYTGRSQFDPNQIQQYMNPYLSNVVGEIGRLGQEQFTQQTMPQLQNAFGDAGQFGSARNAAYLADAAAKSQREISQAQSNALAGGFNQAMQNYGDWSNRSISAGQNAANQLMGMNQFTQGLGTSLGGLAGQQAGIAGQQQQMGLTDVNALFGAGKQQQDLNQAQLNSAYQQFQQQQQYPWQQLNNLAGLFKVPTPQQATSGSSNSSSSYNTNWNTAFRRGGRVRGYADGGAFEWKISPEKQSERDKMAASLLLMEKEDPNYFDHYMDEGYTRKGRDEGGILAELTPEDLYSADLSYMDMPESQVQVAEISETPNLAWMAFDERIKMLERARQSPEFQPMQEDSFLNRVAEAMYRSAGKGPGNWGELIGRAGTAYYDRRDAIDAENKKRALERLAIEEKIAPDVRQAALAQRGGTMGAPFDFKVTPDGVVRVNKLTGENELVQTHDIASRRKFREANLKMAAEQGHADPVAYADAMDQRYFGDTKAGSVAIGGKDPAIANLPTAGQAKQQEKEGEKASAKYEGYVADEKKAKTDLDTLEQMDYALQGLETSKLAPPISFLKAWANAFGVPVDVEKLSSEEALSAITGKMAVAMHEPGTGVMTDADLQFFKTLTPSLAKTREGNRKIIDAARRLAKRKLEIARMATIYREQNPKGILDSGFDKLRDEFVQANPLYPQAKKFDALPDAKQYDGKRIKGDDGTVYKSVNGEWVKE